MPFRRSSPTHPPKRPRPAGHRRRASSERGAVSLMFAVLGGAFFFALALVVDGGRQLGAFTEAQDLADNLARAGAQGVDIDQWRNTGVPIIDPALAQLEIDRVLADSRLTTGLTGAPIVTVTGETVTVEVELNAPRSFFTANRTVTAIETADATSGVAGP